MAKLPLEGIRVIDITMAWAGPFGTQILADFGAEVIKVEEPAAGDITRKLGPFPNDIPDPEKSGLFLHLNMNKLGVTLNIKTATGKNILSSP